MEKITDKILESFDEKFVCPDGCGDWLEHAGANEIRDFVGSIPPLIIEEIKRRMPIAPQVRDDYLNGYAKALSDFTKILNEIAKS